MQTPRAIDWTRIVCDLEALGMTQSQIAAECGYREDEGWRRGGSSAGKVWVNRMKNIPGTQPGFHEGALLLGLWAERTSRDVKEVPREVTALRNLSGKVKDLPLADAVLAASDPVTDS